MNKKEKSPITTHILDLESGKPAAGVNVKLINPESLCMTQAETDNDGRIMLWPQDFELVNGVWRLAFDVDTWFAKKGKDTFFSEVTLSFKVDAEQPHYHVPLLLNAYGYSTYRGS